MEPKWTVGASALILAAIPVLGMAVAAQGDKQGGEAKKKPLAPQFDQDGMKRWMDACKSDFHHEKLADWIGKWDTEMKMYSMGMAMPATKGTSEFKWLVPDKWLSEEYQGEMVGMPVKTYATMGFDRYKQKFVSSWVSSLTTTFLTAEGNFDQSDKVLLSYGLMDEPMSGEHDKCVKYVWRLADPDKMIFEIHDLSIGEANTKVIEITYTRRKS
jgi:uncharacterized protein DUF1579